MKSMTIGALSLLLLCSPVLAVETDEKAQAPADDNVCLSDAEPFPEEIVDDPAAVRKHLGLTPDFAKSVGGYWAIHCPPVIDCTGGCYPTGQCQDLIDTGASGCEQTACPSGQTIHILQCGCDQENVPCLYSYDWTCK